jgi:hypothetical protein
MPPTGVKAQRSDAISLGGEAGALPLVPAVVDAVAPVPMIAIVSHAYQRLKKDARRTTRSSTTATSADGGGEESFSAFNRRAPSV